MTSESFEAARYLWWLALAAAAAGLVYLLSPVLTPFLLAGVLAYVVNPVVDRLQAKRVPRTLGVILAMLFLLGLFAGLTLILAPLVEKQFATLLARLPDYLEWLRGSLAPWLKERFGVELELDSASLKALVSEHLESARGVALKLLPSVKTGGLAVVGFLTTLVLVPVVLFYFLRDWHPILARVEEMIPRRWHAEVSGLARDVDRVLGEFLRGQISVMLIMSAFYATGLWIAGLDYSLPIGVVAGLLVFVPYLGVIVGVALATLVGLLQFPDLAGLVPVWIVFALGQAVEGMAVTPWLVGDRIGLHPVAVIFALLAFGQLFGFFGILLALPASAALLVGLRRLRRKYLESGAYSS
ncbi:MAG: AI-2E family transporter [Betaproteobacteria bacterium]|nr:AI-2E family transporter [Betaproteobacteria bacterium]